jgi:hypothetical protein
MGFNPKEYPLSLNCKPGDLALIVRKAVAEPCLAMCIGRPVKVGELAPMDGLLASFRLFADGPHWTVEPISCPSKSAGCVGIHAVPDACLQPLRGDLAGDEVGEQAERPMLAGAEALAKVSS